MAITTKKLKLIPVGDKNEKNRVYQYIRDGQYNQALCMNSLMSQIGIAYYKFRRDISNDDFKEEMKKIMRKENYIWDEYNLPKGMGSQSVISQQLRSDFSTALKTGLASGKRTLPTYKLSYPLLVPGRLISVYSEDKEYTNKDGELATNTAFYIKFPNKIRFEVVLGSRGKRDSSLYTVLSSLADPEDKNYDIGGSSIYIDDKDIMINLAIKTENKEIHYEPKQGRIMGISFGYSTPCTAYINDTDKVIKIGSEYFCKEFIAERLRIQERLHQAQISVKFAKGGKGRKHKLKAIDRYHQYEKNVARTYNHKLSLMVVKMAVRNHVQTIIFEKITKDDFENNPTMLRNWSYYQLQEYVKYKAKKYGIDVLEYSTKSKKGKAEEDESTETSEVAVESLKNIWSICSKCGENNPQELEIPKEIIWGTNINFCCSCCKTNTEFSENKARNLVTLLLNKKK